MRAALSRRLIDSSSKPASLSRFQIASSLKGVLKTLAETELGETGILAAVLGVTANWSVMVDCRPVMLDQMLILEMFCTILFLTHFEKKKVVDSHHLVTPHFLFLNFAFILLLERQRFHNFLNFEKQCK